MASGFEECIEDVVGLRRTEEGRRIGWLLDVDKDMGGHVSEVLGVFGVLRVGLTQFLLFGYVVLVVHEVQDMADVSLSTFLFLWMLIVGCRRRSPGSQGATFACSASRFLWTRLEQASRSHVRPFGDSVNRRINIKNHTLPCINDPTHKTSSQPVSCFFCIAHVPI